MHREGSLEGLSWLCSPEKAQLSDDPQAKQPPKIQTGPKTQTGPETPFPHLLSRCSRREQTPGEQTLPTCCYLSTGSYHARPRRFPSGSIWPAHDQKHILAVTNMLASSNLLNAVFPLLIHRPTSFTRLSLALRSFTAKQMFHLICELPGSHPEGKEGGPGGVLKEAAACKVSGPEITRWVSPSVRLFASQAQVCSFLPRDPFLSPINTTTAL